MKLWQKVKDFFKSIFDMGKMKASFKTKAFKSGGYSLAISAVAIALVVAANILVNSIPYTYTSLDATNSGMYILQDQTKLILGALDKDVEIYVLSQTGSEDSRIKELLSRYRAYSNHISVETVDPVIDPTFVKGFTDEDVASGSLILVCGERSAVVDYEDMYLQTPVYTSSGYVYSDSFDGQQKITSAIDRVISEDLPKLYVLSGHGEAALSEAFAANITDENFEMETLKLLSAGSVPEDADLLLICAPEADLSKDEAGMVASYLAGGGRLLLITESPLDTQENLLAVMDDYGLEYVPGLVVESDPNYCLSGHPLFLLPQLGAHEITDPILESGLSVFTPMSHAIGRTDDSRTTLRVNSLLSTSDGSYIKAQGYDTQTVAKEEGDIEGSAVIAYSVTETVDEVMTKLVWIGCGSIAQDTVDSVVSGTNTAFLLNAMGWLADKESSIALHSISLDAQTLTVSSLWSNILSAVFIGVLPVGILAYGLAVWIKRRKRV